MISRTCTLLDRRWASPAWLICTLHWRGRPAHRHGGWQLDGAVLPRRSYGFGRRPSALLLVPASGGAGIPGKLSRSGKGRPYTLKAHEIDAMLHAERLGGRRKRLHEFDLSRGRFARWRHGPRRNGTRPDPGRSGPSLVISRLRRSHSHPRWRPSYNPAIHPRSVEGGLPASYPRKRVRRRGPEFPGLTVIRHAEFPRVSRRRRRQRTPARAEWCRVSRGQRHER